MRSQQQPGELVPEPQLLCTPQSEPAPEVVAVLLQCPVRELKQRLAVTGTSCAGVVEKEDLALLVASAEADVVLNEGVPPA